MNWEEFRIGEVVEVSGGGTPDTENNDYWDGDVLWLTPTEISKSNSRFIDDTKRKITHVGLKNSSARLMPIGSILFTSRATIGDVAINKKPMSTNQGFINILCNKEIVETEFLFYWLKVYKDLILAYANGATFLEISKSEFKKIKINLPPLPVQRRIAEILGRYDALIENYTAQIRRLEAAAQNLYTEWFVRGRCPFAEYETGAKTKLKEFVDMNFGQSPSSEFYNESGDGLPFHQGVGTYGNRFPKHEMFCSVAGKTAEAGDILFSVRAPVGRLNIADRKLIIGRGIASLRHKDGFNSFLFYLLQDVFSSEDVIGNGAIFAAVSKSEFEEFKVSDFGEQVVENFEKIARPIDKKILNLESQTTKLRQMRDKLLPRLLSGKILVKVLEIEKFAPQI